MEIKTKGTHREFEYVVLLMDMGFRCGYVKVPKSHPFYNKDYSEKEIRNLNVHGGITFSSHTINHECLSDGYWLGFDAFHSEDMLDYDEMNKENLKTSKLFNQFVKELDKAFPLSNNYTRKIRNTRFMESHCRNLCEQLAEVYKIS